ncbi:MAG: hypothetical protein LASZOEIN_001580 [Candidatus Fervidibacter sp.]|jgi:predicted nucleic acid-binding protein|nr:PIN domain-containing protein [Armatimonadota bacterium]
MRGREIFADTSGWGNLADPDEPFHKQAKHLVRLARAKGVRLITTNYVLAELVSLLLSFRLPHANIVAFVNGVVASPQVEIVWIDQAIHAEAWDLFQRRPDKTWSLVDCASFVVMQKRGINEALTSDVHFEQAGFVRLLK